jgi:hypothetical protein
MQMWMENQSLGRKNGINFQTFLGKYDGLRQKKTAKLLVEEKIVG